MTEIPGGAVKLAKAADRAGLRHRTDQRPPSCLVRIQDDEARIGYVAQYVAGKPVSAYWWRLRDVSSSVHLRTVHRKIGVRDLSRRLTLTRRLKAAQGRLP